MHRPGSIFRKPRGVLAREARWWEM
jgi:hypothetical protein